MSNIDEQYQQALDYIYSFIDYSLTRNLRYSAEKFNLSRMAAFIALLGNPQNDYKVIHVAGTKGKGSTCAMLTSILTSAGFKTGFYSSPHMLDFNDYPLFGILSEEVIFDVNVANGLRKSSSCNDSINVDFNSQNVVDKLAKNVRFTKSLLKNGIVS